MNKSFCPDNLCSQNGVVTQSALCSARPGPEQPPTWPSHAPRRAQSGVRGQEGASLRQLRTPRALAGHLHESRKIAFRLCHVAAVRRCLRRTVEAAETLRRALLGGFELRERLDRSLQCQE